MQCSQPLCGSGFLNNIGPYYSCNHASFPQVQVPSPYPEVIGEGEVASVVFPDGSVHLYFIPFLKRSSPFNCQPHHNSFCNNAMGAYYVRSVSNPITPAVFSQQCQRMYPSPYTRPCNFSDYNLNIPTTGFQLKFHNDCWTSTTDLHYFIPRFRPCDWLPPPPPLRGCASVQVDTPVKDCAVSHLEVVCNKPCLCCKNDVKYCSECESADECPKSKDSKKKNKCKVAKDKHKLCKKRSEILCQCPKVRGADKSVTTVADQGSCAAEAEQKTQTCRPVCTAATSAPSSFCRKELKTELWLPKSSFSGKAMTSKSSEKIVGIYETGSSATCCCSDTGGE